MTVLDPGGGRSTGWLEGYVALVTGGGSGIGRAVAHRFVSEGASVAILGLDADQLATAVASSPDPSRTHAVQADTRDSEQLHQAVSETVEKFGKLDTLVPNAGIWDYQRQLTRLSGKELDATFDEVFAVNVKGYLLAAEAAWRELVKTRGSIIMTLSNASFYVNGGGPIYTASKHACLGLMRELAYELAPKVRVNGVACGGMNTDLRGPESLSMRERSIAASFAKKRPDDPPPLLPLHDSSTDPRDFTGAYVLLASREQSGPVTGQAISVDGGIGVRGFATPAGGDHL
ncbi:SDR family NAD(P)-dependent oxidoreductase [Frankia sp. AgB1.9]|uniref:SDR family NAD(P)-dependent oxidoreductase n=1 Tax=unclassified Frankia TaxID=2632575 RepID=UPI0019329E00|nr:MULTISPECIES: SDR family NAD(P)-dependent oxidoreductase [unclassified Frankia]MBL7487656.1 SDR family NAD(P)-dependent oxidoreductase [Frankia sp. AgW1.1]MBL7550034.1 SDR family NAD(P)-dependent oxidoreductase [Frankia sp. AgB1.9]MBL7621901.1 SDR family NAD(P)-dependent oxidoreductase [Frankia sp. AgB1.8]